MQKKILVLGSTGSIGVNTLKIISDFPQQFIASGLHSHSRKDLLLQQGMEHKTKNLCLSGLLASCAEITYSGESGLLEMIRESDADIIVNGISGFAGLKPSLAAIQSGKTLALANKETLVAGGRLVLSLAKQKQALLLPVDSEHSAVFQLLRGKASDWINQVVLTASGGAFRNFSLEQIKTATAQQALEHPTWNMGKKITIDSATMANKGLEVIEAARLFSLNPEQIKVVIHPQSKVHSLVHTKDSSFYAQISKPDMRVPILNALSFPDIGCCTYGAMDIEDLSLQFFKPDAVKYPMLPLAYQALRLGEAYPIVYNAANEQAVDAYAQGRIGYFGISDTVQALLEQDWPAAVTQLEQIFEIDALARNKADQILSKIPSL